MASQNRDIVVNIISDASEFLKGYEEAIKAIEKAAKKTNITSGMQEDIEELKGGLGEVRDLIKTLSVDKIDTSQLDALMKKISSLEDKHKNTQKKINKIKIQADESSGKKLEDALLRVDNLFAEINDKVKVLNDLGIHIDTGDVKNATGDVEKYKKQLESLKETQDSLKAKEETIFSSMEKKETLKALDDVNKKYNETTNIVAELTKKLNTLDKKSPEHGKVSKQLNDAYVELGKASRSMLSIYDRLDELKVKNVDFIDADSLGKNIKLAEKVVEQRISNIQKHLDKLQPSTTEVNASEFKLKDGKISVKLDIGTTASQLHKLVKQVVDEVQGEIYKEPLQVPLRFVSSYKTKAEEELKGIEDIINSMGDGDQKLALTAQVENLKKQLKNRDFKLIFSTNISTIEKHIKDGIESIQKELKKAKLYIYPEVTIDEESQKGIQDTLDKICKSLQLDLSKLGLNVDNLLGKEDLDKIKESLKEVKITIKPTVSVTEKDLKKINEELSKKLKDLKFDVGVADLQEGLKKALNTTLIDNWGNRFITVVDKVCQRIDESFGQLSQSQFYEAMKGWNEADSIMREHRKGSGDTLFEQNANGVLERKAFVNSKTGSISNSYIVDQAHSVSGKIINELKGLYTNISKIGDVYDTSLHSHPANNEYSLYFDKILKDKGNSIKTGLLDSIMKEINSSGQDLNTRIALTDKLKIYIDSIFDGVLQEAPKNGKEFRNSFNTRLKYVIENYLKGFNLNSSEIALSKDMTKSIFMDAIKGSESMYIKTIRHSSGSDLTFSGADLKSYKTSLKYDGIKKEMVESNGWINELDLSTVDERIVEEIVKKYESNLGSILGNEDNKKKYLSFNKDGSHNIDFTKRAEIANKFLSDLITQEIDAFNKKHKTSYDTDASKYLKQYSIEDLKVTPENLDKSTQEVTQLIQLLQQMATSLTEINKKDFKLDTKGIDSISKKLQELLTVIKELKEQVENLDFSNVNLSVEPIEKIISALENLSNMFQRAFGVASDTDITSQWSKLQEQFNSFAKEDGNFDSRKKEVSELIKEYQKYLDMGGKDPITNLTSNKKGQEKLTAQYNKYVESQKRAAEESAKAIETESKAFETVAPSAKEAADAKERFVEANKDVKGSAEASVPAIKEEKNEILKFYRGVSGKDVGFFSNSDIMNKKGLTYKGQTYGSSSKSVAMQYAGTPGRLYEFGIELNDKVLQIDALESVSEELTYLGKGLDEDSKKAIELVNRFNELKKAYTGSKNDLSTMYWINNGTQEEFEKIINTRLYGLANNRLPGWDITGELTDVGNLIQYAKYVGKDISNIDMNVFSNEGIDINSLKGIPKTLQELYDVFISIQKMNSDVNNLYGYSIGGDFNGSLSNIPFANVTNDWFAEKAKSKGYEAVIFKNIQDGIELLDDGKSIGDSIAVLSEKVVKDYRAIWEGVEYKISRSGNNSPKIKSSNFGKNSAQTTEQKIIEETGLVATNAADLIVQGENEKQKEYKETANALEVLQKAQVGTANIYKKVFEQNNGDPFANAKEFFEEYARMIGEDPNLINSRNHMTFIDGQLDTAKITYYNEALKRSVVETWKLSKASEDAGEGLNIINENMSEMYVPRVDFDDNIRARYDKERRDSEEMTKSLRKANEALASFDSKTQGKLKNNSKYKELSELLSNGFKDLKDVERAQQLMNELNVELNKINADARRGSTSFDIFSNMVKGISEAESKVSLLRVDFASLTDVPEELREKFEGLEGSLYSLKNAKGVEEQAKAYGDYREALNEVTYAIRIFKKEQSLLDKTKASYQKETLLIEDVETQELQLNKLQQSLKLNGLLTDDLSLKINKLYEELGQVDSVYANNLWKKSFQQLKLEVSSVTEVEKKRKSVLDEITSLTEKIANKEAKIRLLDTTKDLADIKQLQAEIDVLQDKLDKKQVDFDALGGYNSLDTVAPLLELNTIWGRIEAAEQKALDKQMFANAKQDYNDLKKTLTDIVSVKEKLAKATIKEDVFSIETLTNQLVELEARANKLQSELFTNVKGMNILSADDLSKLNAISDSFNAKLAPLKDVQLHSLNELYERLNKLGLLTEELDAKFKAMALSLGLVEDNDGLNAWVKQFKQLKEFFPKELLDGFSKIGDKLSILPNEDGKIDLYGKKINEIFASIIALREALVQLDTTDDSLFTNGVLDAEKYNNKIQEILKTITDLKKNSDQYNVQNKTGGNKGTILPDTVGSVQNIQDVADALREYAIANNLGKEIGIKSDEINQVSIAFKNQDGTITKLTGKIVDFGDKSEKAAKAVRLLAEHSSGATGLFGNLKEVLGGGIKQLVHYYFSLHDFIRYFRQGITVVKEFDAAMTELIKVSNDSEEKLWAFEKQAFDIAKTIGSTGKDIVNSAADWEKLGYNIAEAGELAKNSALYSNVGDMDIDTATEHMVSTLQAFNIEAKDSITIVDKFNEVGNNYAITSEGIGAALERSAASFNAANTDIDKSIALITGTNAVIQNSEKVGKYILPTCTVMY